MKSREERMRNAWCLIIGEIVAVAVLLILYLQVEGVSVFGNMGLGPVFAAGIGATLAYLFTRRQHREEEQRRRRGLATLLLSESQVLYDILKDIHQAYYLKALDRVAIEPFHSAIYDQAGGDRLLFQPETVQVLAQFYALVSISRVELIEFRGLTPEQRTGREDTLRFRILYTAERIQEVMHKLSAEGGAWPIAYPIRTYTISAEEPEDFPFPPFPKPPP